MILFLNARFGPAFWLEQVVNRARVGSHSPTVYRRNVVTTPGERRPVRSPIEEFHPAVERIRADILRRIALTGATVVQSYQDQSTPRPRYPEQVIVYSDDGQTARSLGTPLLLTVRSGDPRSRGTVDLEMDRARFERYGPMGAEGAQTYQSIDRAWFIVPVNPNAAMAVDRTGKQVLGWIARG